ncbi:hypothetical protein PCH_Pc12g13560 [Penicillium rubens Wisconsin 54-1255]|uniref:Uncharacterized protein n=1 Tax=Penicillium rubens (strain ATCC 28089 / DSM 1075 / NRRL 1951 / Wisconsin 54-1255) TaxID=500485 RepID=B6H012_PENRW|nr:hypothetical protein PCH_Pc12g13560 [Penicillium rubens Wisconsin 54-1255]
MYVPTYFYLRSGYPGSGYPGSDCPGSDYPRSRLYPRSYSGIPVLTRRSQGRYARKTQCMNLDSPRQPLSLPKENKDEPVDYSGNLQEYGLNGCVLKEYWLASRLFRRL